MNQILSANSATVAVAYGCRYCAPPRPLPPLRLFFNFTSSLCHPRLPRLRPAFPHSIPSISSVPKSKTSTVVSFLPRFLDLHFVTGNCFLSSMERFWTGSAIGKNKEMVANLENYGVIRSKKVSETMESIDRAFFVPEGTPPYVDTPMPIGYNATISAPHMHATCLQLLEKHLQPGMRALDVGSGTGYLTACFAIMVGADGRAVGVEHIPELVVSSIENIKKSAAAHLLEDGSLSVHTGDGREGWAECAPYDAIHVGAAAADIPQALIDQLKPGGRMVIPVGSIFQDLKVVDKSLDGSVSVRDETSVRYVPLTSRDAQLHDD